jgi:hypothetical protein
VEIVAHEWKAILRDLRKDIPVADKVRYLINPPGWSHDGSTKTSEELRRELGEG